MEAAKAVVELEKGSREVDEGSPIEAPKIATKLCFATAAGFVRR